MSIGTLRCRAAVYRSDGCESHARLRSVRLVFGPIVPAQFRLNGHGRHEDGLDRLRAAVLATPEVEGVNHLAAIFAGASEVLVDADLDLAEHLNTVEIEATLDALEVGVRAALPATERVRVLLNSPEPAAGAKHAEEQVAP